MESSGGDGSGFDVRSPRVRRMDELGLVIDRLVVADQEIAAAFARRAVIVEEARVLSVADAAANRAEATAAGARPRSEAGWTPEVTAWRELVSEVGCALRVPERTAETLIANSRALTNDLPATFDALSAGEISYRHAEKLIDHAKSLPATAYLGFEQAVLPHARELTVAKFDTKARVLRERIHPESITTRTRAARECRDVFVDPARDGMAYLTAYVPAAVAYAGFNRVDDIASGLRSPEDARTQAQLRADVFGDLIIDGHTDPISMTMPTIPQYRYEEIPALAEAHLTELEQMGVDADLGQIILDLQSDLDRAAAEEQRVWASLDGIGRGITPTVMVTVPVLTLLGTTDGPGTLEGYGPIDPDTARKLTANAPSFTRILTHPETGEVLSVGKDSYPVPGGMKRWLQLRDETCRHPGCNRTVHRCDIDHSHDWAFGGITAHDNLAHLCKAHHMLKHHTAWQYRHIDDTGTLEFASPTGRRYTTRPAHQITPVRFT